MSLVWLGAQRDHLRAVELIELGSVRLEEVMGEHRLGRIGELLVIEAVYAAEVRDAARRGDAGAPKEHDAVVTFDAARNLASGLGRVRDGDGHDASIRRWELLGQKDSPRRAATARIPPRRVLQSLLENKEAA